MSSALPQRIESLFARNPALSGFCVRGIEDIPDNFSRSGDHGELFVGDISISPAIGAEQFGEIFREIIAALAEVLSEEPEFGDTLRGRTFARTLH